MKKIFILLTLFTAGKTFAQEKAAAKSVNAPVISFETDVIDYGIIKNGSDGMREFKFSNTGMQALTIASATSSCGCTVATPPKDAIKAGEKSSIKVTYNTQTAGKFVKTITVVSNASVPSKVLTIQGEVMPAPPPPLIQKTYIDTNEFSKGEIFYRCKMHPDVMADKLGICFKCNMEMTKAEKK